MQLTAPDLPAAGIRRRMDARLERNVGRPLVLALSGGGDSMALLSVAADWARARGRRLLAVTVDHGLNPASADWSRRCAAACRTLGVDWVERRWDRAGQEGPRPGLTAAARIARHALIAGAAREAGARVVLFAHTADDIDESDWMRARGATLGALRDWSPSPAWPEGRGLMLLRPMLDVRREALRDLLRTAGRDWIEDPANADDRFGRSRARRALGLSPAIGGGGSRGRPGESETPTRHLPAGAPLPLALGEGFACARDLPTETLAAVIVTTSGTAATPRGDRIRTLADRLRSGADFTGTLAGARIEAAGGRVVVGREPGELKRRAAPEVPLTPGRPAVWDGRFEITVAEAGWTVTAAARRLNRLSDADRAVLKAVPGWARGALPVLIREDRPAPVLAWRKAEVRALAPRRLALFLEGRPGERTQEADLGRTIHGETPPTDLFSGQDNNNGAG